MTIEGAIADLQDLIDNDEIPFWAKPSLRKVMETVEMEREQHIEERKTGKWITEEIGIRSYATKCSVCGTTLHEGHGFGNAQEYTEYVNDICKLDKFCHECGTKMEVDDADSN